VEVLARHFLGEYNREFGKEIKGFSPAALAVLKAHDWPGNVRELRNVVERAVLLAGGDAIMPDDLVLGPPAAGGSVNETNAQRPDMSLEQVERLHILEVLRRVGGNKTRAAEILGVSTETLRRRLKEWNANGE
jgi:DNA-binding NtrC family response regulator